MALAMMISCENPVKKRPHPAARAPIPKKCGVKLPKGSPSSATLPGSPQRRLILGVYLGGLSGGVIFGV